MELDSLMTSTTIIMTQEMMPLSLNKESPSFKEEFTTTMILAEDPEVQLSQPPESSHLQDQWTQLELSNNL
jgi:hypothetical protein